jgi:predicted Zn-dependent peptidase
MPDAMAKQIDELFGAWPATPAPALPAIPAMHTAPGPTWIAHSDPTAVQVRVSLAFAAVSPRTSRAARVILAQMVQNRVTTVREKLAASYGVHVRYEMTAAGDYLWIDGQLDSARAGEALGLIQRELAEMRGDPHALAHDFVVARRTVLANELGDANRAASVARRLETRVINQLPLDEALAPQVAATTLAAIAPLIAQDLDPTRMVAIVSGQAGDTAAALAAAGITPQRQVADQPE